jgi:hypothetical protein
MSTYRSMIDEAMANARSRLNAGVKVASVSTEQAITKEASELANALEYLALTSANDGSAVGSAREEVLRDFFKQAAPAGAVPHGATAATGVQAQAPEAGKTKLAPVGLVAGAAPAQTTAPVGPGPKESFKQAGNQTLYDILMGNKTAEANPMVSSSTEDSANPGSANENANASQLKSEAGIVAMSKREAKKPTRARLAEVFSHTSDSLSQETAQKLFPQANSGAGGVKEAAATEEDKDLRRRAAGRTAMNVLGATGGLIGGGLAGSVVGGALGVASKNPLARAIMPGAGASLGGTAGSLMGMYHANKSGIRSDIARAKQEALSQDKMAEQPQQNASSTQKLASTRERLVAMAESSED